jgi:hypothetical protein
MGEVTIVAQDSEGLWITISTCPFSNIRPYRLSMPIASAMFVVKSEELPTPFPTAFALMPVVQERLGPSLLILGIRYTHSSFMRTSPVMAHTQIAVVTENSKALGVTVRL